MHVNLLYQTLLTSLWHKDLQYYHFGQHAQLYVVQSICMITAQAFFETKLSIRSFQHIAKFIKQTHTRLMALFRDYPGEPVPER